MPYCIFNNRPLGRVDLHANLAIGDRIDAVCKLLQIRQICPFCHNCGFPNSMKQICPFCHNCGHIFESTFGLYFKLFLCSKRHSYFILAFHLQSTNARGAVELYTFITLFSLEHYRKYQTDLTKDYCKPKRLSVHVAPRHFLAFLLQNSKLKRCSNLKQTLHIKSRNRKQWR